MKKDILEGVKAILIPETTHIRSELVGFRTELKVMPGQLDRIERRLDEFDTSAK